MNLLMPTKEITRSLSSAPPSTALCGGAKAAPRKANYPQRSISNSL